MIRRSHFFYVFLFAAYIMLVVSCSSVKNDKEFSNSPAYNFADPKEIKLPEELDEISGIVYYPKDTSVFAIVDEAGSMFKIPLKRPNYIKQWKFDKKRDYEDIVLVDSTFYILVSNGDIEKVNFSGDSIITSKSNFSDFSKSNNEFESLYFDADSSKLILLCKSCEEDSKKIISRFSYSFREAKPAYANIQSLNTVGVSEKLATNKHMKASAAAINPLTGELYVISSIIKLLVVYKKDGEFKELFKLDPAIYKQPEGIAFTPEGDLIISNEFAENGFGTLLLMKNKKKGK